MYKCFIIDDEPIAIRIIRNHLSAFKQFEIIGEFNNALDVMGEISEQKVDLIFCDIQMPQLLGTEFVKTLSHPPKIIFTTAFRDYAIEAFDLNVVDYLLKPISFERFAKAINKFLEGKKVTLSQNENTNIGRRENYIFLKADKKLHKLNLDEILYFESLGDYVIAYTINKKITTKERISHLEESLPTEIFIRIHRSFIVSISQIEAIGAGFVEINKKKLPIGRNYKNRLDNLLSSSNL